MSVLKRAYAKATTEGGAGHSGIARKKITFTLDHSVCAPGVFDADLEVTVQSLSAAQELQAAKSAKGDATVMAFEMAKLSVLAVDGEALDPSIGEDEFFWEALDQGGRQLVVGMFARVGTPDDEAAGKAEASLKVH